MANIENIENLDLSAVPKGSIRRFWLQIISDPMGFPIQIPVIVARGAYEGVVLGLTAAIHGNELNGIPAIQQFFQRLDVAKLHGTVVGIPVVNVVSYIRMKRRFTDGVDLNHIMPGHAEGVASQVYAFRFFDRIARHFNYLLDLHTASFGYVNSFYIRADMNEPTTARLALMQNAQIILHNPPLDGTLRGATDALHIPSITVEAGNPHVVQRDMVRAVSVGIHNVLHHLGMLEGTIQLSPVPALQCRRSYWLYTDNGGLLHVLPQVADLVKQGQLVAILQNVFGEIISKYYAPEDGIVIGKSACPTHQTGGRILHLGIF